MLVANVQVDHGAVRQLLAGPGNHLLEQWFGFIKLVLLHGPQGGLVALQSLGVTGVFRHGFLRGSFLSHVQNSSCALCNGKLPCDTAAYPSNKVSLKGRVRGNVG